MCLCGTYTVSSELYRKHKGYGISTPPIMNQVGTMCLTFHTTDNSKVHV